LAETAKRFQIREVPLDKAYLGYANLEAIEQLGAVPYIPFKSNSQGDGPDAWRRLWHLFHFRRPEFLEHYHQRSNVEAAFSAVKRKLGGSVRSKSYTAQVNEVLCKTLAYNLTVLVQQMFGIRCTDPVWAADLRRANMVS
jgi:transposase